MTTSAQDAAKKLLEDSRRPSALTFPEPDVNAAALCREAQNTIRAAIASSTDAIAAGSTLNRLSKLSEGKSLNGNWTSQAQDSLRAAVLFAGAGIDRALKSLVDTSIPALLANDTSVQKRFEDFSTTAITDRETQTVDPQAFVRLFLNGGSPAEVLQKRWIDSLTASSAQSAERVEELCSALGVTADLLRRRTKPNVKSPTKLQLAFKARNLIAHELDVTKPLEEVRKALEQIRQRRTVAQTEEHVSEILSVAQEIVNDVARRLAVVTT